MKPKIYIAGKVTGEAKENCQAKFNQAQKELEELGFDAINPVALVNNWNATWSEAMRICIAALMECEAIYMLPCSGKSKGAKIEHAVSKKLGMPVLRNHKMLTEWKSNLPPTQ